MKKLPILGMARNGYNMLKILEIKSHKLPSTWKYRKLDFIGKDEYDNYQDSDISSSEPIKATIFDGQIKFMPPPSTTGQSIILSIYLSDSITEISDSTKTSKVQPEVQDYFDKAIEYYTTSELASDPNVKEYWMNKFEREIAKYEAKPHSKHQYPTVPECNW